MRPVLAVIVWIVAAAAAVALSTAISSADKTRAKAPAVAAATTPVRPPATSTPAAGGKFDFGAVKPTDADSMFVGSNFRRALGVAERHLGSRADIESVLLTPGRLLLTVLTSSDKQYASVLANDDYGNAAGGQLAGSTQVFYLSQLGAGVPSELVKLIERRAHVAPASIRYMAVQTDRATNTFYWAVHQANDGPYFLAPNGLHGPLQEVTTNGKVTLH
jgi:hypothetical protein